MKNVIDLRSDTVTHPTGAMRKAMYEAEVGDDVLREDPTINRLEARAAEVLGKEASLFVPSGTFGNQLALFTHCSRGNEVILSETAHIVEHEAGAASMIASVQLRTIFPEGNWLTWDEIDRRIRKEEDIHHPYTGCIALENALGNGAVQPLDEMKRIAEGAGRWGIPVHLDGARIFNASLALGVDAAEIAACTDSVMFCLSKGLCAPVGSMLVGTKEFIEKARRLRKVMGGGMRQAGILAAAGLLGLEEMRERLSEDHASAEALAGVFSRYDIFEVHSDRRAVNMVFLSVREDGDGSRAAGLVESLKRRGVLTYEPREGELRFVTHYGITSEDIKRIEEMMPEVVGEISGRP